MTSEGQNFDRSLKYGSALSHLERQLDPDTAELRDIVESQYYAPRRIDIERIYELAALRAKEENRGVRILDLGGGRGFLAKLLADKAGQEDKQSLVIDLDIGKHISEPAEFYKDTPNLSFVRSDTEKEARSLFSTPFDLVIVSWAHRNYKEKTNRPQYDQTIKDLAPTIFINIGHEDKEITGVFDPGDAYIKIGEWYGPETVEIRHGHPSHSYGNKVDERIRRTGGNVFEIFVRNDITPETIELIKRRLQQLETKKLPAYRWEQDLNTLYPEPSQLNFDKKTFWREQQE